MTMIIQNAVMAAVAVGALFTLHGSASAATTEQASICQPYLNDPAGNLSRTPTGLINVTSGAKPVICPVVRSQDPSAFGMWTYANGFIPTGTVSCTLWSFTNTGALVGSTSATFTGSGNFELAMHLPKALVPSLSAQSVVCSLPASGRLFSVTPML
jgi:hypothetical protein